MFPGIAAYSFVLTLFLAPLDTETHITANTVEPRENYINELEYWRFKDGDAGIIGYEALSDSTWHDISTYERTPVQGTWWAATQVNIVSQATENKFFALLPDRIVSAFDVYWDGVYLSSNGVISRTREGEVVGKYFSLFQIPRELSGPGTHIVSLHISNWHLKSRWERGQFFFGYYDSIIRLVYTWQLRIYFLLGIVVLAMFLNVFLSFTSQRRRTFLLFAVLCLGVFLSLLLNYYWAIADISNAYLDYRNALVPVTLLMIGIALPAFFLYEFAVPHKPAAITFVAMSNIAVISLRGGAEEYSDYVFYLLIANVLALTVWALAHKREGALPILVGSALSMFINLSQIRFGIDSLTVFNATIIICYTYILAKQFARNERLKQQALVRSIRLENQLLKRCISPHYLLNSLTSIIAWLRKEPSVAIKLVEALSEEFRIVSQISDLQKISVKTELELCRTHLKIMNYRRKADFSLEVHDIDPLEEIPPMIFHTLIENGITHAYENRSEGRFVLCRTVLPDGVAYRLFNDAHARLDGQAHPMGTGLKYVQARLEESYPGRWSLNYGKVKDGYEVNIAMYSHLKKQK